jgi:PmbA protein
MTSPHLLDTLSWLLKEAKAHGADAADAVVFESLSSSVSYRFGKLEDVERSESRDLGLRVFIGQRQAAVASTDLSRLALKKVAERAVAMARLAPEDPYCGLAPHDMLARQWPELDLEDRDEPSSDRLGQIAKDCERSALSVQGVTNSEGASASFGRGAMALATSEGFAGSYAGTSASISASVVVGEGTGMERDYDHSSARFMADLDAPDAVGRSAAERALKRLNPRKVPSQSAPVVYDPRVSMSIVGHFAGAIHGMSVARGTSFLKDKMGEQVFSRGVTIVDDPHRARGLRSKPFDGEGVSNQKMKLLDDGVLTAWVMDCAAARQLGLKSNGHAARGTGGPPSASTTNLYMEAGAITRDEMIRSIKSGLYVTEMIGSGVNGVTGDYSRGAAGFWIENGELAYPVSEITIAGNLKDMFLRTTPASDLKFRYGSNAPTLLIEGMTIAGS